MAWEDRIRDGGYTSPSGIFVNFIFEDVSRAVTKKTTAFNFPDFDGTFVQDLGHTGRRYPLRLFFSGQNYDDEIDVFEEILLEKGIGILHHPFYGNIDVVPFGEITRSDNLKTAGNQGVIEITFWETVDLVFPFQQRDPEADIEAEIEAFNQAIAGEFVEIADLESVVDQNSLKAILRAIVLSIFKFLNKVAAAKAEVENAMKAVSDGILLGMDLLIGTPLALALSIVQLAQLPGRTLALIKDKLRAYRGLFDTLIGKDPTTKNSFLSGNLAASAVITGAIIGVLKSEITTRKEALSAAEELIKLLDDLVLWQDKALVSLGIIDTGASYQKLKAAVSLAAGFLVQTSFSLKQERHLILTRPRSIIDLTFDLYGNVADKLDFFIETNDLSGDEILELPKGFDAIYYL